MTMTYFIIVMVVLLIVAPIIAVLPSKRQKEQMALRRRAMSVGISVELVTIDDPIPRQDKYLSNTGKQLEPVLSVVAYRLSRPAQREWRHLARLSWCLERRSLSESSDLPGTWCWHEPPDKEMDDMFREILMARLSELPQDVVRVEERNRMVSVYWHERSGEAGLAEVVRFLKETTAIAAEKASDDEDDSDPENARSPNGD